MYGAYYGTVPSIHKYIDTSQPLNGFGAAGDMLTIYEGVGALPSAPAKRGGCGCSKPALGRLAGFGTEILPDSAPPVGVTMGTNVQTALVALLVAGSAIALGFAVAGGSKGTTMRANGRRASRRGMRKNGRGTAIGGWDPSTVAGWRAKGARVGEKAAAQVSTVAEAKALAEELGRVQARLSPSMTTAERSAFVAACYRASVKGL
jgi:hypothetical protein